MKEEYHSPDWEFDFSDGADPKGIAEAFVKRVDGTGVRDEEGREVEFSTSADPDSPGKVYVWATGDDLTPEEIRELADDVVYGHYFECRRLGGAKGKEP